MEINDDNIAWALGKLAKLRNLRGAPTDKDTARLAAEDFLKIVHNEERTLPARLARRKVNDADYLIEVLRQSCEWFPPPAVIRRTYALYWRPATDVDPAAVVVIE